MKMDKAAIIDLQTYFDGRAKLNNASIAIKSYSHKNASLFFGYVDGFNNKRTINIPIAPTDILPILENYIDNIDKEIINIANGGEEPEELYEAVIENEDELVQYITDYANRYPNTFTSLESIKNRLSKSFLEREDCYKEDDYHIEVCSDWQNKIYVFAFAATVADTIYFKFEEIYKL